MAVMRHCSNCQTPLEAAEEDLSDAAPSPPSDWTRKLAPVASHQVCNFQTERLWLLLRVPYLGVRQINSQFLFLFFCFLKRAKIREDDKNGGTAKGNFYQANSAAIG